MEKSLEHYILYEDTGTIGHQVHSDSGYLGAPIAHLAKKLSWVSLHDFCANGSTKTSQLRVISKVRPGNTTSS